MPACSTASSSAWWECGNFDKSCEGMRDFVDALTVAFAFTAYIVFLRPSDLTRKLYE
jgi:hypothetical protein